MKKELTIVRHGIILLLVFASGMLFSGCRKDKKNPITFDIMAHQPHLDAPISGVKWTIRERKYKGWSNGQEYTDWTMEGETDANGQASAEFIPFKNTDYSYLLVFDYSDMDLPNGEYSVTKGPTDYALLSRSDMGGGDDFELRILPKMDFQIHYLNANCFDGNDTFKYKTYNKDEYPNLEEWQVNNIQFAESPNFNGCADYSVHVNKLAGHYIYIWEAVRNGITETGTDTFFVAPGVNSTINMHW